MNRFPLLALVLLGGAAAVHAQLGANLVQNGSAEQATGAEETVADFAFWSRTGAVYSDLYSSYPLIYVGGMPTGVGLRRFSGGSPPPGPQVEQTSLRQTVDLAFASSTVDAGRAAFDLSAWFNVNNQNAGTAGPEDEVALQVQFLGASSSILGTSLLGPFDGNRFASDPSLVDKDVGFFGALAGAVPTGSRSVVVSQLYTRHVGTFLNTGMDLVSFRVQAVPEPASLAALAFGALAVLRRRKR